MLEREGGEEATGERNKSYELLRLHSSDELLEVKLFTKQVPRRFESVARKLYKTNYIHTQ